MLAFIIDILTDYRGTVILDTSVTVATEVCRRRVRFYKYSSAHDITLREAAVASTLRSTQPTIVLNNNRIDLGDLSSLCSLHLERFFILSLTPSVSLFMVKFRHHFGVLQLKFNVSTILIIL